MAIEVRDFVATDHEWARALLGEHGGGDHRVARLGELLDPVEHAGLVAVRGAEPIGLLTVAETDAGMEILSLHSREPGIGAGSRLLTTALDVARASDARRLWLVTTNDNTDAVGWYLRRGLHVSRVHERRVDRDRETVTPAIPTTNPTTGLPIRDLIELEVDPAGGLQERRFPDVRDLDALPADTAAVLLGPLFERAPRFLARLAERRPFGGDDGLIRAARDLVRELREDEAIELLNAHPRIGADPATVSALSHAEQGYDTPAPVQPWIAEELQILNDAYERVFGFRFVIFVAGRPRSAIVPILETSLRDDRASELRRGLDDVVHIAADRLATLRR